MKPLAILLLLCGTAAASNEYARPPQPYELQGVRLSWANIPWQSCPMQFETGWKLDNPEGLTCQLRRDGSGFVYNSESWFSCRIRVEPISKTLTIVTASECDEP